MMNELQIPSIWSNIIIIILGFILVYTLDNVRNKRQLALRNSLLNDPILNAIEKTERFNFNITSIAWISVFILILWKTGDTSEPLQLSSEDTFSTDEIVLLPPPNLESSSSASAAPTEESHIPTPDDQDIKKPEVVPPTEPAKPNENPQTNNTPTQGSADNPISKGQGTSTIDVPSSNNSDNDVLFLAEDMPSFPGCEEKGSDEERQRCTEEKMLKYIYANLKYPQLARDKGIQGQVWIEFVVEKDGSISNVSIKKDLKGGCGEAAQTAVSSMNASKIKWTPGKQKGRPVKVKYTLPINFKLK